MPPTLPLTSALPLALPGEAALPTFTELVREQQSMVYSLAWHYLRDRGLAEDVAQEAFLRLHGHLGALQSQAHALHWLRKVTVRLCIDEIRRHPRTLVGLDSVLEPSVLPSHPDPLIAERLRALVATLPGPARMAIILRYQEDLDPAEIAELLQEPVNTIKSRLQRALAFLRERIERPGGKP